MLNVLPPVIVVLFWGYKNWQAHGYLFLRSRRVSWKSWRSVVPTIDYATLRRDRGILITQVVMWAGTMVVYAVLVAGKAPDEVACVPCCDVREWPRPNCCMHAPACLSCVCMCMCVCVCVRVRVCMCVCACVRRDSALVIVLPCGYYGFLSVLAYQNTFRFPLEMAALYTATSVWFVVLMGSAIGQTAADTGVKVAAVATLLLIPVVWLAIYNWAENSWQLSWQRTRGAVVILFMGWSLFTFAVVRVNATTRTPTPHMLTCAVHCVTAGSCM